MDGFEYVDLVTFVVVSLGILGVIVLINNAVKAFRDIIRPVTVLREEVDKINEKLADDYKTIQNEKELNRLLLKSVRQLLEHEVDGDNIQGMIDAQTEIDRYLLNHA